MKKLDAQNGREALPRYLTIGQAAEYLNVSVRTLSRLVQMRQIAFIRLNILPTLQGKEARRGAIRFDRAILDGLMARNVIMPPPGLPGSRAKGS